MKPILIAACFCLAGTAARSQNCNYYFLQNGKTAEITVYNKKNAETGKNVYKISSVNKSGTTTTAVVNTELFDKKGKSFAKATNNMKCEGGALMVDLKVFMSPEQAGQLKAQAKAADVYLSYPTSMKPGDALEDGRFTMDIKQDNGIESTVTINITDRKVEGQESVTTPAGTWNCFKITYKSNIKITMMGIGIPVKADVTEWFAPNFGVVKTESKGSTTVLTRFE
jgi:hypothetical protein